MAGKTSAIVIHVHVGEKVVDVTCGTGDQRVKWLAHVAVARTDEIKFQGYDKLGLPTEVRRENGTPLDMTAVVKDTLGSGEHIIISTSMEMT